MLWANFSLRLRSVTAEELFTTEVTSALSHTTGKSLARNINWNAGTCHPYAAEVTLAIHAVMLLQVEIAYIWKPDHRWQ